MQEIITRFAPSPTGYLHVGNIRTALINYLFTRSMGGKFMLRIDDTDLIRSKLEFEAAIEEDLGWLGLSWDIFTNQSSRKERYLDIKQQLINSGRLYACYETEEELAIKRKMQLSRGLPPIYDRSALKLTDSQKQNYHDQNIQPHYRFLIKDQQIGWNDLIKGDICFEGKNLSDPILIRQDMSMTYILCSVVDDIDFNISHIIRGEDHITNTAIQTQIFESLSSELPTFAHLALMNIKGGKISKRIGGFEINQLRKQGFVPEAINSLLTKLGTSEAVEARSLMVELINEFDIKSYGLSATNYDQAELIRLNHKLIQNQSLESVNNQLTDMNQETIDNNFWQAIKANIFTLTDIKDWQTICNSIVKPIIDDPDLLTQATQVFPSGEITIKSFDEWIKALQQKTTKRGRDLFMPIRRALTAQDQGPDLSILLTIIGRDRIIKRLNGQAS